MLLGVNSKLGVCLALTGAISRSRTVEEIYAAALDALADGLGVSRSSILLFDSDGVMRFKAFRGLSPSTARPSRGTHRGHPRLSTRSRSPSGMWLATHR